MSSIVKEMLISKANEEYLKEVEKKKKEERELKEVIRKKKEEQNGRSTDSRSE